MNFPILFGTLLFILSSVLFISERPDWIACLVSVVGAVLMARLLTGKEKEPVRVFCIADWRSEAREDKS